MLGPIFVLKLRFAPKELDRSLVAEMWLYPDGSRILELSTKCPPAEAFQAAAEARAFLAERGVDLAGEQETKTRKALEFFSEKLKGTGTVPPPVSHSGGMAEPVGSPGSRLIPIARPSA